MRTPLIGMIAVSLIGFQAHAQETTTLELPAEQVIKEAAKEVAEETATAAGAKNVESLFLQLPGEGQAFADVSFAAGSSNTTSFNSTKNALEEQRTQFSSYDFNYLYGFSDSFQLGFSAGFAKSSSSIGDNPAGSNVGMRDFGVTVQKATREENHTLVYGLATLLSPEPAASSSNGTSGSNFSGATTLSPFAAYQTRLARGVVGAKLAANFIVRKQRYDSQGYINDDSKKWNFDLTGFYEFPVHRIVNIGLAINLESDETVLREAAAYSGEFYTGIKVSNETLIRLSAAGSSYSRGSDNYSDTQVGVGLRTSL